MHNLRLVSQIWEHNTKHVTFFLAFFSQSIMKVESCTNSVMITVSDVWLRVKNFDEKYV